MAAGLVEHTATTAAKLLIEVWSAALKEDTTEEQVIGSHFSSPDGVTKIGKKLHIRKVAKIPATSGVTSGIDLTYTANTEAEVTGDPVWAYTGVEMNRAVFNRLDQDPKPVYRNMLKYGLVEALDQACGQLGASLSTNIVGSGLAAAEKGLLLDAEQKMATSCKRMFRPGKTPWHLVFHPSQIKNLLNIFDFTADSVVGSGDALKSGWYSRILNATLEESGNIYQSSGVTHNMGFIPEAFCLAYNEEPTILPPQDFEMVVRLIATMEYCAMEVYDEYAVDIQTA